MHRCKERDAEINGRTQWQTDKQIERWINKQANNKTDRQTDRQTDVGIDGRTDVESKMSANGTCLFLTRYLILEPFFYRFNMIRGMDGSIDRQADKVR